MTYIIQTQRLGMRESHPDDAEAFFALCSDPDVMRYVVDEPIADNVADTRRVLAEYPDYTRHGFGRWTCIEKASGRFIGFSGLKRLDEMGGEVDLGYRFFPEFWGRGYATESGLASVDYGFDVLGLPRIIGMALPENVASVRVLQKCGMTFERFIDCGDGRQAALYAVERS